MPFQMAASTFGLGSIVGGAYEAQRLTTHQNLGPGVTLRSVRPQNFCRQMLLDPSDG